MPALMVLGGAMMSHGRRGAPLFATAIVMAAWIALVAARFMAE